MCRKSLIILCLIFPVYLLSQVSEDINTRTVSYINIVVHILESPNQEIISDQEVYDQIHVLNKDFSKQNDNLNQTPASFLPLAADMEVQFCLATTDPQGNASNGITRTSTSISEIGLTDFFFNELLGGKNPWNNKKYINVWVADMGETGILGFSTFPGQATPNAKDGILINRRFFGVNRPSQVTPHNLGKVLTHEMGHYFGLQHIWGQLATLCEDDDGIDDTPLQNEPSFGCPDFPKPDLCTQGNGIMFMNFMDYSDDACLSLFTEGQKDVVWETLNTSRTGLLENPAEQCIINNIETNEESFLIYPNPTKDFINVEDYNLAYNTLINVYDQKGMKVFWAKASPNKTTINLSHLAKGIYLIQIGSITKKIIVY